MHIVVGPVLTGNPQRTLRANPGHSPRRATGALSLVRRAPPGPARTLLHRDIRPHDAVLAAVDMPTELRIDEIPCIFSASREFGLRDESAHDCLLSQVANE